jgi:hypothetical protein
MRDPVDRCHATPGSSRGSRPVSNRNHNCLTVLLALALLAPLPLQSQELPGATRIVGRVTEPGSNKAIMAVLVRLKSWSDGRMLGQAETDAQGRFLFDDVPGELVRLEFERLGYQSRTDSVRPVAAHTVEVNVRMSAKPVELDPITVTVRPRWLELNGFYERRQDGMKAYVIDRAMIEKKMAPMLTDLLDQAPSVNVLYAEPGRRTVRFNRVVPTRDASGRPLYAFGARTGADARGCEPDLYVDGHLQRNSTSPMVSSGQVTAFAPKQNKVDDFNVIAPIAIEAIEVYVGNTPVQFHHECGVVLIWTRRGSDVSGR